MASKQRSRRSWPISFKKRVVAEASQPGVSAAWIARQYDLNANLLFNWKKKYGAVANLIPVEIVPEASPTVLAEQKKQVASVKPTTPVPFGLEIELPCGTRLRCGPDVDAVVLGRALTVLRGKQ